MPRTITYEQCQKIATRIVAHTIMSWYDNPSNDGFDPHFHMKMYKKIKRDQYFEQKRQKCMEFLAMEVANGVVDASIIVDKIDKNRKVKQSLPIDMKIVKEKIQKKSIQYKPKVKVNLKNEPYVDKKENENIYTVLESEVVELKCPELDEISITTQIINDNEIKDSIHFDNIERDYHWNAWKLRWDSKAEPDPSMIEYRDLTEKDLGYFRFLADCKKNTHQPIKVTVVNPIQIGVIKPLKEFSDTKANCNVADKLITLPNKIKRNGFTLRLAYYMSGDEVTDVKYVHESEYSTPSLIYADCVNTVVKNGFMMAFPKLPFCKYDEFFAT